MVGAKQKSTPFNLEPWNLPPNTDAWNYSFLGVSNDAYNSTTKTAGIGLTQSNNFRSFTPPARQDGQLKGYLADLQTNFSGKAMMNSPATDLAYWANAGTTAWGNPQMSQLNSTTAVRGDMAVKRNGQAWSYGALEKSPDWLTGQGNMSIYNVYRSTNGGNIVKDQVGNLYNNGRGIYRNGDAGTSGHGNDAKGAVGGAVALILLRNLGLVARCGNGLALEHFFNIKSCFMLLLALSANLKHRHKNHLKPLILLVF